MRTDMNSSYKWTVLGSGFVYAFVFLTVPVYLLFCVWCTSIFSLLLFGCQYQCNWLPGKTRLRNDLLCVEWDVKPYTLTHSLALLALWQLCVLVQLANHHSWISELQQTPLVRLGRWDVVTATCLPIQWCARLAQCTQNLALTFRLEQLHTTLLRKQLKTKCHSSHTVKYSSCLQELWSRIHKN